MIDTQGIRKHNTSDSDELLTQKLNYNFSYLLGKEGTGTTTNNTTIINQTIEGVADYTDLDNLPAIEGVTLIGDQTYEQLNANRITNTEIEDLLQ